MTFRTMRAWIVLVALGGVIAAGLAATSLADLLAGAGCVGGSALLIWLDGLRRSGRMR